MSHNDDHPHQVQPFSSAYIKPLSALSLADIATVGGKNASLGEMLQQLHDVGIRVPQGFATTIAAFNAFMAQNQLAERIQTALQALDVNDVAALQQTGERIRNWVLATPFPPELEQAIEQAYQAFTQPIALQNTQQNTSASALSWAVRSSATAEDLPDASFAGQQETYLNISGLAQIKTAIHHVFASLFNDRAIAYRAHQGYADWAVAISAGVQTMVRSDLACSGVMFTLDTESGFRDAVFITGSYGLGEMVVQGAVNPDEFYVYKPNLAANKPAILQRNLGSKAEQMIYQPTPEKSALLTSSVQIVPTDLSKQQQFCLSDEEIEHLARFAVSIEQHYQRPMDIEWAKDGIDDQLYIVQARPETVRSQMNPQAVVEKYRLNERSTRLTSGRAVGQRIGSGTARLFRHLHDMERFTTGDVLLTDMTDPDWEPIMKRAAAIITNRGGRTCHAAIIARELGIPAVVGCGNATDVIADGTSVTVSCAEGDTAYVYEGALDFSHIQQALDKDKMPDIPVKLMLNVGNPTRAFDFAQLPNSGVGLARLEFIINQMIGIHPKALLNFDQLSEDIQQVIHTRTAAYQAAYGSPLDFYRKRLQEGIATLAAAFSPNPVIMRFSDFKSNEYANLIGGSSFEPNEENPMIGFRGASRYISDDFRACFELECQAMRYVRETMGLSNLALMIPFVRTVDEARQVIEIMADNGLVRGEQGLQIMMMCELPANALLADEFLPYFDGFSIGSNDLTQLTLGLDRDSALVAASFDERNPAVLALLEKAIQACRQANKYIGICGQGPSDHPELAEWLLQQGIESMSLNPDTMVDTWLHLAKISEKPLASCDT
ncbi:MAG: phosphoenolpyruvate synthase [bacterium]